jgi:hypothetical protein
MPPYDPTQLLTIQNLAQTYKAPLHIVRKVVNRLELGFWVGHSLVLLPQEVSTFELGLRAVGYPSRPRPNLEEDLQLATQEEATP